jgi:hypothetical protein
MLEAIGALFITGVTLYITLCIVYMALATTVFTGLKNSWPGIVIAAILSAGIITGWWFLVGIHIHLGFG